MARPLHLVTLLVLFALATLAAAQERHVAAPPLLRINGTASQPVRLAALTVDSRVVGHLARTTVELTFRNPNPRVLEGELQFPLLDGQQVTGFALDFDGKWRPAVAVEKARGQEVFEDVTRTRIDPALLEATRGNNFKLRLYPIPAQGVRRVSLTLSERMPVGKDGTALFRLPLPVSEPLERFAFRLAAPGLAAGQGRLLHGLAGATWQQDGAATLSLERRDYQPEARVDIALAPSATSPVITEERDGRRYFYAELPGRDFGRALRPVPARLALVWDASGSGADRDHGREFALLDAWFKAIVQTDVQLTLARDRAEDGGRFPIRHGDWSALRAALEKVVYDGATNPAAFKPASTVDAMMLFSDGLTNYGQEALPAFTAPLLAVSAAASADVARLRHAADASGGAFVDLLQTLPAAAARALLHQPPQLLGLRGKGATELIASPSDPATGRIAVAGILSEAEADVELQWRRPDGRRESQHLHIGHSRQTGDFAATAWARLKLDDLDAEYALHRAEIQRLGKGFGLVTRNTSMIVLDRVEDYARYEIQPPVELRADYARLLGQVRLAADKDRSAQLEQIVARFKEKQQWWDRDFPKDEPVRAEAKAKRDAPVAGAVASFAEPMREEARSAAPVAARPMAPASAAKAVAPAGNVAADAADKRLAVATEAPVASIQLKKWTPDAPYADRLRHAANQDLYRVYLDERPGYLRSTAFFLDAADIFFERKQPELALRILSNLAEMDLENRQILRILGERLRQAKQPGLAIYVLERVLELAPNEPQSWRDLGLAEADNGQVQQAVDHLYETVRRPWHGRFADIELIALAELNGLVATAAEKPDVSAIDSRLLRNLPLDLRAVLTWDADNTDIDLWVTDPNGEKAFYGHRLTYQGGAMSRDFTGGYGPEEFSLKKAKPGRYLVQAQFYGHNQQIVAGATTLHLRLSTGFGTARQRDQDVTLRLASQKEVVTVGEFVVGK